MNDLPSLQDMEREVRALHKSDQSYAERSIREYLEDNLSGVAHHERIALLDNLMARFHKPREESQCSRLDSAQLSRLFSVLMGETSRLDTSSPEVVDKLAEAINTIFDTLNQLMSIIHVTLLGPDSTVELQTLRHFIGSNIDSETPSRSLEEYLAQIKQAFLIAHQSFIAAAEAEVDEILLELDPEKILSDGKRRMEDGVV